MSIQTKIAALILLLLISALAFGDAVESMIELDYPTVAVGRDIVVYALITLHAPESVLDLKKERNNLNLALVIDRSGSMEAAGKMSYAKEAAKILVDQLTSHDRLAVVEYDDQISVLYPSSPVESPRFIKEQIERLYPRGMTNLTGGMMEGVEQVLSFRNSEYLHRVILLSDGLANKGITEPYRIRDLVRDARRQNVRITTLGLGADFNEDLMQMIAENSGGNYYFIENPRQMVRIYKHELDLMYATTACDVECIFTSDDAVNSLEVFGYPSTTKGNQTIISMEDFYAGENRSLLLRISFDRQSLGKVNLGAFQMSYKDLLKGTRQFFEKKLTVRVVEDEEQVAESRNDKVVAEALLFEADKQHEASVRQVEAGQFAAAGAGIGRTASGLREKNKALGNAQIAKKIEALEMEQDEIKVAQESTQQQKLYVKNRKAALYSSQKGNRGKYILQSGDSGFDVENLQRALVDKGFFTGDIDGEYSDDLTEAVKKFQASVNLEQDGIAGPKTLKALDLY